MTKAEKDNNKARCCYCEGKIKIVWERAYNPKMSRRGYACASTRTDIAQGSLIFVKKDVWREKNYVCLECGESAGYCYGGDESKLKQEDSKELIEAKKQKRRTK